MKILTLALLLAWPWGHKESGTAEIQPNGVAIAHFKKNFAAVPSCSGSPRSISREWVEYTGKPGAIVKWTCREGK